MLNAIGDRYCVADSNSDSPRKRGPGRPFEPGKSGNPGGKNPEREAMRRYVLEFTKESIDGIANLARTAAAEKVRAYCYVWLAEQAIGKATQAITGPEGGPVVDVEGLMRALNKAAEPNDAD
jgi:hypothetical protein